MFRSVRSDEGARLGYIKDLAVALMPASQLAK